MKYLDIENWNRKALFEFYNTFADPYFAVTVQMDVTQAYRYAKESQLSFFAVYLHDCLKAVNAVEPFRYRVVDDNKVVIHDVIHASATMLRPDNTFGFSFIDYDADVTVFHQRMLAEKARIVNSTELFPPKNSQDCIYCSALPWLNFTGHKEAVSGVKESVPKFAFGKLMDDNGTKTMSFAISVSHALMDGYHLSLFTDQLQANLLDH